jgi:hypothetical protein
MRISFARMGRFKLLIKPSIPDLVFLKILGLVSNWSNYSFLLRLSFFNIIILRLYRVEGKYGRVFVLWNFTAKSKKSNKFKKREDGWEYGPSGKRAGRFFCPRCWGQGQTLLLNEGAGSDPGLRSKPKRESS